MPNTAYGLVSAFLLGVLASGVIAVLIALAFSSMDRHRHRHPRFRH